MSNEGPEQWIVATEGAKTLPIKELLTGRGFVSGKSGSGKSNTVSVICEELLSANYTLLIIDTEGEYFGLKEEYDLLHVGGDEFAEVQVGPEHAENIVEITLEKNVPVILDVSGYDDTETSEELIKRVVDELYTREKHVRKPFLLVVEEMQEYLPQQGGSGELGELLERVAKRGRKRGLGMCGVSQRPSSVDKDYITQCDWMVWHKFTWESDLKVVSNVIGKDRAKECENFDPGEAYMMTDWDDKIERVQFRRKNTFDAGATPGLESVSTPNLKQVSDQLVSEIHGDGAATASARPDPTSNEGPANTASTTESLDAFTEGVSDADDSSGGDLPDPNADVSAGNQGEKSTASDGATSQVTAVDSLDEADLEGLDDEEIVSKVSRVNRENQILKDELEELREISSTDPTDSSSPFTETAPVGAESSPAAARAYGPPREGTAEPTEITPPARPVPPAQQDVDNNASRALFEFGELMIYLWQVLIYYIRYTFYKIRVVLWNGGG